MKAAAQHLTSVTLELGGKSPTVIDASANLEDAAKRIAFGKFLNNGQTCIAPDYILIDESVKQKFINRLKTEVQNLFGAGKPIDENSMDYARIINRRHFDRLDNLLKNAIELGAKPDLTGTINGEKNFMSPVILSDIPAGAKIMEEEIFGPLLPIITFKEKEEVVHQINSRPKPLALYIFSQQRTFRDYILRNTSAGGVCINECVLQFTHPNLPFGGVNNSGLGKSHGHAGFLAFSNEKPVLKQKNGWAGPYLLYPPYTRTMKRVVDVLLKWF
jgi:aldehyde dehydrogenase (NAD+)